MTTWNNLETSMHGHLIKKKCALLTMSELYLRTKTEEIWGEKVQPWWQSSTKCIIKTMFWCDIFYVEKNLNWHLVLLESWNSLGASAGHKADWSYAIFILAPPETQSIFLQIPSDFKQKNHQKNNRFL